MTAITRPYRSHLYGVLDRLVGDGLVERDRDEVQQGRLRRYYRLTEPGRLSLSAEVDRQRANVRAAGAKLRALSPSAEGRAS